MIRGLGYHTPSGGTVSRGIVPTASDSLNASETRLQSVLEALDDPDCRTPLTHIGEPMSVDEASEALDIPRSTTCRKLDLLSDASLVDEHVDSRTHGKHATPYAVAFEEVRVARGDDRSLGLELEEWTTAPDARLSDIRSEVRSET